MKRTQSRTSDESVHVAHQSKSKNSFFKSRSDSGNTFFRPAVIQPRLKIGRPGDKLEKQADRVADKVVNSSAQGIKAQMMEEEEELQMKPDHSGVQKKCRECEEEEAAQMKPEAQPGENSTGYAPSGVSRQIQNSGGGGSPLPAHIGLEMSHKMGVDFSNVSVHTGTRAAEMNEQLDARAFTHGNDIYFNSGEYSPETSEGKHLLAHELTHVVQQGAADHQKPIQRSVATSSSNCPANTNNAPANPVNTLESINEKAVKYARGTALSLDFSAILVGAGDSGFVDAEYERAFGLPPASGGGFMNRLTGSVRPSREAALSEEMEIFSKRFDLIADFLEQPIAYRCDPPLTWGGCNFSACDANDNAAACTGVGAVKICANFWNHSEDAQAGILIHEVTHIYWAGATHNIPSNLRLSQCYEELVAQIYGFNAQSQVCPVP